MAKMLKTGGRWSPRACASKTVPVCRRGARRPYAHVLSSVSEMPSDVILDGLHKSRLENSVQLQTAMALYDQETAREQWQGSETKRTIVFSCIPFEGQEQTERDKNPHKQQATKMKTHSDTRSEIPCRFKCCKNPSCKFWHPHVCQNYKSEKGCSKGRQMPLPDMLRQKESPTKRSKKGCAKGSVP